MTDQEIYASGYSTGQKRVEGWTNPNPMVGAVIVKDGKIIGEGYHKSMENFTRNVMQLALLQNQQKVR